VVQFDFGIWHFFTLPFSHQTQHWSRYWFYQSC
jgi:hypothetical protein